MSITLTNLQQVPLSITAIDAAGTQVSLDSVQTWTVSDTSIIMLLPAADGLMATAVTTGKLGPCSIHVAATSGGKSIEGSLDVLVVPSEPIVVKIVAGDLAQRPI